MLLEIVSEASLHGKATADDALHILRLMRAGGLEPDLATWSSLAAVWARTPLEPHPLAPPSRDNSGVIPLPQPTPGAATPCLRSPLGAAPTSALPFLSPQPSPRGPGSGASTPGTAVRQGWVSSSKAGGAGQGRGDAARGGRCTALREAQPADGGMMEAAVAAGGGWAREIESIVCGLLALLELEARHARTGPRDVWVLLEQMRRLSMPPSRCFVRQAMEVRWCPTVLSHTQDGRLSEWPGPEPCGQGIRPGRDSDLTRT
jgi:hypothetical protein